MRSSPFGCDVFPWPESAVDRHSERKSPFRVCKALCTDLAAAVAICLRPDSCGSDAKTKAALYAACRACLYRADPAFTVCIRQRRDRQRDPIDSVLMRRIGPLCPSQNQKKKRLRSIKCFCAY